MIATELQGGVRTTGRTEREERAETPSTADRVSGPLNLSGRDILLAMDGSPSAIAAGRIAQALAANCGAFVHVLSVVDTRSAAVPPPLDLVLAMGDAVAGPAVHAAQEAEVRAALSTATAQAVDWPVRIALGTPAGCIVKEAKRVGAALIIVGLRRHGRLDRAVHDETALSVMQHASCAVLGVTEDLTSLPVRLLAAMDFTETSLIAARAAQAVAADGATLVLAYVSPVNAGDSDDSDTIIRTLGVNAGFTRVQDTLRKDGITFDHVIVHQVLPRTTAESLLEYADGAKTDLIAAGSVRRGRMDRWLMGSVSTDLVRDGRRSVLIVPPPVGRR